MADILSIKGWLNKAQNKGCRYLVIAHDLLGQQEYPIYIKSQDEFWERLSGHYIGDRTEPMGGGIVKHEIHEVYDLEKDIDSQIREARAFHAPAKLDA